MRATAADFCGDSLSFFVHLQGESVAISSCTHDTNGTLRTLAKHLVRRYKLFVSLDTRIGHFEPSCSCFPITGQVLAKSPGAGPFQSFAFENLPVRTKFGEFPNGLNPIVRIQP